MLVLAAAVALFAGPDIYRKVAGDGRNAVTLHVEFRPSPRFNPVEVVVVINGSPPRPVPINDAGWRTYQRVVPGETTIVLGARQVDNGFLGCAIKSAFTEAVLDSDGRTTRGSVACTYPKVVG